MKNSRWLVFIPLALAILFCTINIPISTEQISSVETSVSATLTALAPAPVDPVIEVPVIVPETGFISGHLSYPSDFIPPLRIVFWNVNSSAYQYIDTSVNQFEYNIELPVGTYYVVAYAMDEFGVPTGLAGGYTKMVPCGLQYGCEDHALIPVAVPAGATVSDIDPGDWYGDSAAFPPVP